METVEIAIERSVDVVHRWCGGAVLVLRVDGDEVLVLEGTASLVWAALEQPATAREIVDELRPWAPPGSDVHRHVAESIDQLRAAGLVIGAGRGKA